MAFEPSTPVYEDLAMWSEFYHLHCTDTAPASSPFLTLLGGAFLSFGPEFFTFCVAFIDGHNTRQRQMSEILDIHLYIDNIAINNYR